MPNEDKKPWENFRTTYGIPGIMGFSSQPRTLKEAENDGWIQIGSCDDSLETGFLGERYARSETDVDMVVIYDSVGYVAGMQSIVPVDRTMEDKYYGFSKSSIYNRGKFFERDVSKLVSTRHD